MKRSLETYLYDILEACNDVQEFVENMSYDSYADSKLTVAAVERKFSIIGEALNRLRENFPGEAEKISDIHKIIGFRNILVHGYHIVDAAVVWSAITENLPLLKKEIQFLLEP